LNARTVLVTSCVAAVLAPPSTAEACGGPVPSTPAAFTAATAVFLGTVENVTGEVPQAIVATFLVNKPYRGAVEKRIIVSGYCDVAFSKGVTYLVYAAEHGGVLLTSPLHRTRPLSAAAEDVRYLDSLLAGHPQAVVYGDVFRRITQPNGSPARQALFETLAVVAVSRQERRSVFTDRWGPYQIVLAHGEYELWVARGGRRVTGRQTLRLRPGDERRLSFTARY